MTAKPWFPTFIYQSRLLARDNEEYARALRDGCHEVREQDAEGRLWCRDNYPGGYTSYGTWRTVHRAYPAFADLERKIWPHVRRFARRIDMDLREAQLAMTDCWVNIMARDAAHPLHLHPGATVSGTYYVSTPPGCAGLRFEDPRLEKFVGTPPRRTDCRPANRQYVSYEAEAGTVILFESWMRHEVAANPTDAERVSVSFNYTWV